MIIYQFQAFFSGFLTSMMRISFDDLSFGIHGFRYLIWQELIVHFQLSELVFGASESLMIIIVFLFYFFFSFFCLCETKAFADVYHIEILILADAYQMKLFVQCFCRTTLSMVCRCCW